MSDSLEAQVNISRSLLASLDSMVNHSQSIKERFENQAQISQSLNQTLDEFSRSFSVMKTNFVDMTNKFNKTFEEKAIPDQANFSKEFEKGVEKANQNAEQATTSTQQITDARKKRTSFNKDSIKNSKLMNAQNKIYVENNKILRKLDEIFVGIGNTIKDMKKSFMNLDFVKRAVMSGGWTLLFDIPRLILTSIFSVFNSVMSMYFNFFKTTLALPFMVAKEAVKIGNAFREDIIVNIGNAYQATKEYADANSNIGKGIQKMQNVAVGALKTFENPRSYMVQLFGEGAAGAAAFITEISKAIDDMGPVAEIIGPQVSNSKESAEFLLTAIRGLGLTSKEVSYYALDSAVTQQNIFDRLTKVKESVSLAASNHSVDAKQVSLGMQKLRTNIKDFGHLSDTNLANLVARMRQLNVGAEELTSIFSKFTSFEDSAKTAAMLQQSFNMNIDALDMITARDPGEIVDKFRDAMLQTGRDYEDLNRHEKQLMQSTTGMSDAMLKSLMTYRNMGLSYEEAKQRVADDDPTKKQIESIKSLTSSIKQIQKIMTFTSPFQAFMKGLAKNGAASDKVVKMATSLSNLYEHFYTFGLNLGQSGIDAITKPVIMIVSKLNDIFRSNEFKSLLMTGTQTIAGIVSFVTKGFGVSNQEYTVLNNVVDKVKALNKVSDVNAKADRLAVREKANYLISTADKSVLKYLKTRGVITEDKRFVEKLGTEAVLNELKQATLHVKSKKGKENLAAISKDLREFTNTVVQKHVFDKEFSDNYGIKGQVAQTTENFQKMFDEGGGMFMSIFKLGGKIMGAIIKGFAIAFASLLYLLTDQIDTAYKGTSSMLSRGLSKLTGQNPGNGKSFDILQWLGITKKEKKELSESVTNGLRGLVKRKGKIFKLSTTMISALAGIAKQITMTIIGILTTALNNWRNSDMINNAAFSFFVSDEEQNNIASAASGGEATKDINSILEKIQKNKKSANKRGAAVIYGQYFEKVYDLYKKDYPSNTPYGEHLTYKTKNAGVIQNYEIVEIMEQISKTRFLESLMPFEDYKVIKDKKSADNFLKSEVSKFKINLPRTVDSSQNFNVAEGDYAEGIHIKTLNNYIEELVQKTSDVKAPASSIKKLKSLNIKDGFVGNVNSIFSDGALKLITDSGQVISPDSMDELASLSGKTQSSLIKVFSGAANVYQAASSLVNSYSSLSSNESSDEASEDLIQEMINLFYETIEASMKKTKNNKVKLEVRA